MANTKYILKEEDYIIGILRFLEEKQTDSITTSCISWNSDNSVYEEEFAFVGWAKWDGCSHFNFLGEDFLDGENDSYYHLCGLGSYVKMMKLLWFTYEAHMMERGENSTEQDEADSLKENPLFKDLIIEKDNWGKSDDEIFDRYLASLKQIKGA